MQVDWNMHLAQTFQTQRGRKKASARHFDRPSIARVPIRQLISGEGEVQSPTPDDLEISLTVNKVKKAVIITLKSAEKLETEAINSWRDALCGPRNK